MSKTMQMDTLKNLDNTAENQKDVSKKNERRARTRARARARAKKAQRKELLKEQQILKAKARENRRIRKLEKKIAKSRNHYIDQDLQVVFKSGYICLMGHWVERVALQMSSSVPERALNQRRKRDGYPYHITIANAQQTAQAMRSARSLRIMNEIAAASSLPVNLGLGMVQNAQNESRSWYCVISWPAGQQIRRCFSLLPQDLHLTLGFDHKDIHIHKGPSTLLTHNIAAASLNREQIEGLIYAALLESYTSKDGSLKSLTLALAQAKLIQDEYLISSAENNLIRVQRGERLKEIEGPTDYQLLEDLPQRTVTSVADITVKLESLQMAQKQRPSNYLVPEISERRAMTNVIRKLETLEVDLK